jgi:hypothetical protein
MIHFIFPFLKKKNAFLIKNEKIEKTVLIKRLGQRNYSTRMEVLLYFLWIRFH